MSYKGISYESKLDGKFEDSVWNLTYTLLQTKENTEGSKEERTVTFASKSTGSFSSAQKNIMTDAWEQLSSYAFDLFQMSDNDYLELKGRLENVAIKNNKDS